MQNEAQQQAILCAENRVHDGVLSQVREELDDHRIALNEHTNEIESVYELLNQLSSRLDKLQERLDTVSMLVSNGKPEQVCEFKIHPLSSQEKEVFFALYPLTETTPFVTYHQLARKLATSVESVARSITALISKSVPVEKKYSNGNAFLGLDKQFRQVQAKENIAKLDTKLTYWSQ